MHRRLGHDAHRLSLEAQGIVYRMTGQHCSPCQACRRGQPCSVQTMHLRPFQTPDGTPHTGPSLTPPQAAALGAPQPLAPLVTPQPGVARARCVRPDCPCNAYDGIAGTSSTQAEATSVPLPNGAD